MPFTVVIEQDEDGVYVAHVPALPGCHTQGRTLAELDERIREAIALCLEVARERGEPIAETRLVGIHQIDIA
ncbi:MAG: type II toxin-antitoxin system HicB family antitoxin [Deltaproteobacteria bacterium]|nr:type II toxin-antitoxin system HicB family antitoxin [Deltaproteobacteria bacterium]